jgi:polysaccharide biosynthesis transport protein
VSGSQGVQLSDSLRAVRRRWPVVVLVTLLVVAVALTVSFSSTRKYDASAELLFGGQAGAESIVAPGRNFDVDPERQLETGVQLIKLDTVAAAVRRRLGLQTPIPDLLEQIETSGGASSDVVEVRARDTEPRRAAAIANAVADEYVRFRRRTARQALDRAAELAATRLNALSPTERTSPEGRELRARQRELEITAALQTGGVEVVRRARIPQDPSRPRPKIAGVVGGMLGLLLGAALALALEFADRRLKDESEIEEIYELPVLGSIPPPSRRDDNHLQREAYGLLAANVRLASSPGDAQVVMVTSPSPGDGKTSVALGLARALARLGPRVILLEADLRRPAIARYTGLGQEVGGLTTLLTDPDRHLAQELIWFDAATQRPVTLDALKEGMSFAVLPAGSSPPNPQRLLGRPEMASVVEVSRSLADFVIIDTPPIGTVNDAASLSRLVDSVLVVSRLNQTTKDAVRRSLRVLRNLPAALIGVVITDVRLDATYAYYGTEEREASDASSLEGSAR